MVSWCSVKELRLVASVATESQNQQEGFDITSISIRLYKALVLRGASHFLAKWRALFGMNVPRGTQLLASSDSLGRPSPPRMGKC